MPGHRPEFGDTLIPTLARGIGNLDSIAREAIRARERQDVRNKELAIDQRNFEANQRQLQIQNKRQEQQFQFQKEQARNRLMNTLINQVDEPYQKAAIAKQYGQTELANQLNAQGDREADIESSISNFQGITDSDQILLEAPNLLKKLEFGSPQYNAVVQSQKNALEEKTVTLSELMDVPGFAVQNKAFETALLNPMSTPEQSAQIIERYNKFISDASNQYRGVQSEQKDEELPASAQSLEDILSDDFIEEYENNLRVESSNVAKQRGLTDAEAKQAGTKARAARDLASNRRNALNNQIKRLEQTQRVGQLSNADQKTLEQLRLNVGVLDDEIRQQQSRLSEANRIIRQNRGATSILSPERGFPTL